MRPGDLVLLKGSMWSSWRDQGKCGVVVDKSIGSSEKLLVMFDDGVVRDYSGGYESHFEVIE